ncbi:MAG: HDOD domain-containing protein [Thermodesulfobacteriota bacterium]
MTKPLPDKIGRFRVVKELGKGSQGVVFLAVDPQLDRQVAIKTLLLRSSRSNGHRERILQEARTVSRLQHPNIIPVYEVGEHEQVPYLVFEYVDGVSLRDLIRQNGGLVVHRSVQLIRQILEGISYAHEQGVIHRDISPSNILVNKNDVPRIMDFGISVLTGSEVGSQRDYSGTPCYMSPEHFSNQPLSPQADLFSLGLVFYEMLTGQAAIQAENDFAAMYKIAHESITPPSSRNSNVDQKLDAIVLKALAKNLASRYGAASEMKKDLDDFLSPEPAVGGADAAGGEAHGTVEFLMRRMRHKSDFPTFSQCIAEINQKASVRDRNITSASQLANVIVKDYALTNKLLKLVNSAFYGNFAGAVTTVSRAVVILGFEQVRFAAASLMLFDHLQNKSQRAELEDSAVGSFMSALIAKDLGEKARISSVEEAFICAMLHRLGKHLVIYYFPEEYEQIKRVMVQKGFDENAACRAVLGIPYDEIGSGVAKAWKFPDKIVRSMKRLPQGKPEKPSSEEDYLWTLSNFSNDLCQIVSNSEGDEKEKALSSLISRFDESLSVSRESVAPLLESAKEKIESYSKILNINPKKSRLLNKVENATLAGLQGTSGAKDAGSGAAADIPVPEYLQSLEVSEPVQPTEAPQNPDGILLNGIQDITNTLLEDYEINDVITMILETMYRGFRFNHVLFCLMDKRRTRMAARFGFGENIDKVIDDFQFPVNRKSADVFNLGLSLGKDLAIDDSRDPRIKRGLPDWYLKAFPAPAFILCPIIVNNLAVGLVYADRESPGKVLAGSQIKYMKTLCNQAVLAMKQLRNR